MELLSPVGSIDGVKAAILNGADSIYLGLTKFSARKTNNFSLFELKRIIDIAHSNNIKVYLAMNTLVKNRELKDFINCLKKAYELGIDAVIIQELSLINLIKKNFQNLKIHVSTQSPIFNSSSIPENIDRIVLPRELSIEKIKNLKTNKELEVFIHGALCVSISGQCLFSSFLGGRSGNRGECAQPCRKKYNNTYYLSTKDLLLINKIPELAKANIKCLKIEGRLRSPYYTGITTRLYKTAINCYFHNKPFYLSETSLKKLKLAYNRTFTQGKIFNDNVFARDFPSHRGLLISTKTEKGILISENLDKNEKVLVRKNNKLQYILLDKFYTANTIIHENFQEIYKLKPKEQKYKIGYIKKQPTYSIKKPIFIPKFNLQLNNDKPKLFVKVYNRDDAIKAYNYGADIIYIDIFNLYLVELKKQLGDKLFLSIPRIVYDEDIPLIKKILKKINPSGILTGNPAFLNKKYKIHLDYNFNVFNDLDLNYYKNYLPIISPELSIKDLSNLKNKNFITLIQGKIILMNFTHNFEEQVLKDEIGEFIIKKIYNGSELINGKDLSLLNLIEKLLKEGIKYFYLDLEKNIEIIKVYRKIINREKINTTNLRKNTTIAWFFKGIN